MGTEDKHKNVGSVQTYTDDMVKVIEDSGGTLVKKIIKEEEAREAEKLHPKSKKNSLFAVSGSLFLIFGLAILFALALNQNEGSIPAEMARQSPKIIFTDSTSTLEIGGLGKEKIAQVLFNKKDGSPVKEGGIEAIYLTEGDEPMGLRHFVALSGANLPLDRIDFVGDEFLIGVFNERGEKNLFFLFKARSFPDIFPAMRIWEKKMFSDLRGFFGLETALGLESKSFEDSVIKNKNARVLYGDAGQPVLFYIFLDEQSTIIATSLSASEEVRLRLAGSEIKR